MDPDKKLLAKPVPAKESAPVYKLKITLLRCRPAIWRRVLVGGGMTLDRLHAFIQEAMGWDDCHLHLFDTGVRRYADPAAEIDAEDESKFTLRDIAPHPGDSFAYTYDFGDDWRHKVVVEEISAAVAGFNGVPVLLKRSGACPREDSGGFAG